MDLVDKAFKEITDQYKDLKDLKPEDVKRVANTLNDAERLLLCAKIGLEVNQFNKESDGTTWCNAYAAYVNYLFQGDNSKASPLMRDGIDPTKYDLTNPRPTNGQGDYWELGTKEMVDKFSNQKDVDARTAQELANQGKFVIALDAGHVAIVMPGEGFTNPSTKAFYPSAAQQGNNKFMNGVETTITLKNGTVVNSSSWAMNYSWGTESYKSVTFYQVK